MRPIRALTLTTIGVRASPPLRRSRSAASEPRRRGGDEIASSRSSTRIDHRAERRPLLADRRWRGSAASRSSLRDAVPEPDAHLQCTPLRRRRDPGAAGLASCPTSVVVRRRCRCARGRVEVRRADADLDGTRLFGGITVGAEPGSRSRGNPARRLPRGQELATSPATEQARFVREREVSPVELAELYLERIERLDPELGAFARSAPRRRSPTRAQADAAEEGRSTASRSRSRISTRPGSTTFSCKAFAENVPDFDLAHVARLARPASSSSARRTRPSSARPPSPTRR